MRLLILAFTIGIGIAYRFREARLPRLKQPL